MLPLLLQPDPHPQEAVVAALRIDGRRTEAGRGRDGDERRAALDVERQLDDAVLRPGRAAAPPASSRPESARDCRPARCGDAAARPRAARRAAGRSTSSALRRSRKLPVPESCGRPESTASRCRSAPRAAPPRRTGARRAARWRSARWSAREWIGAPARLRARRWRGRRRGNRGGSGPAERPAARCGSRTGPARRRPSATPQPLSCAAAADTVPQESTGPDTTADRWPRRRRASSKGEARCGARPAPRRTPGDAMTGARTSGRGARRRDDATARAGRMSGSRRRRPTASRRS